MLSQAIPLNKQSLVKNTMGNVVSNQLILSVLPSRFIVELLAQKVAKPTQKYAYQKSRELLSNVI